MATVFWDSSGIVFIDYLEKGKTITGEFYATLLNQLNDAFKEKRSHLQKKKVLFHQDDAPAHTSTIAMLKYTNYVTFLWKMDFDQSKFKISKNVMIKPFFPQRDILAHKKIKVFVTHCGGLSTQEAIWRGVQC